MTKFNWIYKGPCKNFSCPLYFIFEGDSSDDWFFFIKPYILVARFVIRSQVTPNLTSNSSFDSRAHTVQMEG